MNSMHDQTAAAVDILKQARIDIGMSMTDNNLMALKNRIMANLERDINQMAMNVGAMPVQGVVQESEPLTVLFGRKLPVNNREPERQAVADFTPGPNPLDADDIDDPGTITIFEPPAPILSNDQPPIIPTPEQAEGEELKKAVDDLFPKFSTIDNKGILDTYSDLEIRGVAIMAGLPFTETEPKKITNKELDQIKAAIKRQAADKEFPKLGKSQADPNGDGK